MRTINLKDWKWRNQCFIFEADDVRHEHFCCIDYCCNEINYTSDIKYNRIFKLKTIYKYADILQLYLLDS